MSRLLIILGAGLAAASLLAGCDRAPLSGPPELRLGRDECVECGMIINDDRCSSDPCTNRISPACSCS